ncbi:MAG: hypothetical protein KGY51_01355 [Psychroflexus sp.]|nr:hypothetical protein [Psychroflexus sp.]
MKFLSFLIFLMVFHFSSAQTYEIGPMLGSTTFVGDVGSTQVIGIDEYAKRDKISYGILFRWNRSKRHSFRFSAMRIRTFGIDNESNIPERQSRNLSFFTDINEISIGLEYTFWEWDLHALKRPQLVPYLSTGLAYFFSDQFARAGDDLIKADDLNSFALPLTLGVKTTLGRKFVLSAEFSARYTFTDNLDGSAPSELDGENAFPAFGNPNSNDWYIFAGFSLTYAFGRKPCYNCSF